VAGASDRVFAGRQAVLLLFSGLVLTVLSRAGWPDFPVSAWFYDAGAGRFPLKHQVLFELAGHEGLRWVSIAAWLFTGLAWTLCRLVPVLRPWSRPWGFMFLAILVSTFAVSLLKNLSAHSCPWSLEAFGGEARWFALFSPPPPDPGPGHCWPGGHASGGFALLAGYFAFRARHVRMARAWLLAGLVLGAVMSAVQIARGAHFLTHNLWSLWIVWACLLACHALWPGRRGDGA
jgi:membrane-associated PAP2 superfamily phosphatase